MPLPAAADAFKFSTGSPDGCIATLSRPNLGPGLIETETADDFILSQQTSLTQATFTGLIPAGASVTRVEIEFYHVFPTDSAFPPSGNVISRTNSPADNEIAAATRDSLAGSLRNRFAGSLIVWRVSSRLPSPALSYRCPRADRGTLRLSKKNALTSTVDQAHNSKERPHLRGPTAKLSFGPRLTLSDRF